MSLTIGYLIPGSPRGGVFTLPDDCFGFVTVDDTNRISAKLRSQGGEPSWQAVRGAVLRLARSRRAEKQSQKSLNDKQQITDLGREGMSIRMAKGALYVSPYGPRIKGRDERVHGQLADAFTEFPGVLKLIVGVDSQMTESTEARHVD